MFGTNLFQIFNYVSVPTFCHFLIIFVCFWIYHLSKTCTNQQFGLKFCGVQQDNFHPRQDYEQLISTKNRVFISLVGPSRTGKSQLIHNWLKLEHFNQSLNKFTCFINTLNLFTMLCKRKLKISNFCKD